MKKEDFFKYCEFIYDVLFEFDRKKKFKTDDTLIFARNILYHSRKQCFSAERLGNIFYLKHFKRRKIFDFKKKKCLFQKRMEFYSIRCYFYIFNNDNIFIIIHFIYLFFKYLFKI